MKNAHGRRVGAAQDGRVILPVEKPQLDVSWFLLSPPLDENHSPFCRTPPPMSLIHVSVTVTKLSAPNRPEGGKRLHNS